MEVGEESIAALLFTNLQLLGMDVLAMEGKYHIPFHKDMFNLPNKAGSEAVLHFLFDRLNPILFKEQFRDCWPVIDRKAEMQFRKVCNTWLTSIQSNNPDAHLPRINAALLLSPGGRKYIDLLYRFSRYVLTQTMVKEHGVNMQESLVYPVLNQQTAAFGDVMKSALEDSASRYQAATFEQFHLTVAANRKWQNNELVKAIRRDRKKRRELENEKWKLVNALSESAQRQALPLPSKRTLNMFDSDQDIYATKRGQRIQKARSQWEQIMNFSEGIRSKPEVLKSVLDPNPDYPCLDGAELGVRLPNSLLQDFQKEIQQQNIDNVYIGGRLNLESVARLWNLCLKRYREQITAGPVPDLSGEIPALTAQVHQHRTHLEEAQTTREEIQNSLIPKLEREVQRLHKRLEELVVSSSANHNESKNNASLGLTAPTPPFEATQRGSQAADTPVGPTFSGQLNNDTPDAVTHVMSTIDESIHQTSTQASESESKYLTFRLQTLVAGSRGKLEPSSENQTRTTKPTPLSTKTRGAGRKTQRKAPSARPSTSKTERGTAVGLPLPTVTPSTRKQTVEDRLADMVVESVLDADSSGRSPWSPGLISGESPGHDLDLQAFVSKDLLARSPEVSSAASPGGDKRKNAQSSPVKHTPAMKETSPFLLALEQMSSLVPKEARSPQQPFELFSPAASLSEMSLAESSSLTAEKDGKSEDQLLRTDSSHPNTSKSLQGLPHDQSMSSHDWSGHEAHTRFAAATSVQEQTSGDIQEEGEDNSGQLHAAGAVSGIEDESYSMRFPGDGETSPVSQAVSPSSSNDSDDISKDSLISPRKDASQKVKTSAEQDGNESLDDFIAGLEATLVCKRSKSPHGENGNGLLVSEAENTESQAAPGNSSGRPSNRDQAGLMWPGAGNISSSELLDLDSGDDLTPDLRDSFSPLKGGIFLSGRQTPSRGERNQGNSDRLTPSFHRGSPKPYSSVSQTSSLEEAVSKKDKILAQMQQTIANIMVDSSDED